MDETAPNVHRDRSSEVDERLVSSVVTRMMGRPPTRLIGRETQAPRFVWEAVFADRLPVIVKAESGAGADAAVVLEAWAIERARALGVPAPEVLGLDTRESDFPGPVLILEKVQGQPLPPRWRPPSNDETVLERGREEAVWRDVGGHLRSIHSISVGGFGRLDDAAYRATGVVRGACDRWDEYAIAPALDALHDTAFDDYVSAEVCMLARECLDRSSQLLAARTDSRLLHGEPCAKHIFVSPETQTLSGIIDFGDRQAGDPAWEFANVAVWEDDERLSWLLSGYGDGAKLLPLILVYSIARALALAHKRFRQGRIEAADPVVAWLVPRLRKLAAEGLQRCRT
jgi:aminoglycoside phosphotransferase (APT) family kinase protein